MDRIHEETFFTQEDMQMANMHRKGCSTPLAIREYHYVLIGMSKMFKYIYINKITNTECW